MRASLALLGLFAAGCADGPAERFARDAAPVLEARCSTAACHGVPAGDEWPAIEGLFFRLDAGGRLADLEAAREAARARISTGAPRASTLLRVALPASSGGGPHAGGALFNRPDDEALEAMLRWIEIEDRGGEDAELSALERQYASEVIPVLRARCSQDGCHGRRDVAFGSFALPSVAEVSGADVRASRLAVRALLDLWGSDPARSRLVQKALGADSGGLVHRGGAATFFPEAPIDDPLDAPAAQAILRWARSEREALGVHEGREPSGVLFVDGPASRRAPYRVEPGPVGSDLFMAGWPSAGEPENLTAHLHPEGAIELRDPALSHDAARVAFAMRREGEARFAIYELTLATREVRRVTRATDPGSFVQPTYAPDGRIIAAWDGHDELGADGSGAPPELVALDRDGALERLTFTPAPEVSPAFLATGRTRGALLFGTRREGPRGPEGVLFRFPLCHDPALHGEPEYHVHLGATLAPSAPLLGRDLPDGRQVMIVLPSSAADDDLGMLAVADRSLGPHLEPIEDASVSGYKRPIAWLDTSARSRDPAALPDGRVLVAIDGAIAIARIDDGWEGARLGALEAYARSAIGDGALRSPVPVLARPAEDEPHAPFTDPALPRGRLALRDLAVLESLYQRAAPRGVRALRDDIVSLRLLASAQARERDVRRYEDGGTTVGLSPRIPARILAELALPADRSALLSVPARTPIRLSLLDAEGMEIGRSLDRWYYAEGGETVPGGTNARTYAHACAGCHGRASGDPREPAGAPPDALSSASITLTTHASRDRRRPLPPREIDAAGERIDFVTTLEASLRARCASAGCHGGDAPAADLPLDDRAGVGRFPAAYEALVRFVDLESLRARESALIERMLGRELDAPTPASGTCPPEGPDAAIARDAARWIEAGAFYDLTLREAR